jgi:hypothetical protein
VISVSVGARPAAERRYVMRRKLQILFSALSLLLCVAVCVLWVRSYLVLDTVQRYRLGPGNPNELYQLNASSGAIGYGRVYLDDPSKQSWPRTDTPWHWVHQQPLPLAVPHKRKWSWLGFASWDVPIPPGNGGGGVRGFQVPLWSLTLVFGIASTPLLSGVRKWRNDRRSGRSGLCTGCGYDLRASPARCPECGRMPEDRPPPHNPPMHSVLHEGQRNRT